MKVGYLNKISPLGLTLFTNKYSVTEDFLNADLLLVRSANMHEHPINDNLLAIARAGAGVNNIPLDKMAEKGIVVFNTPGANANGVKELVIAGMLMAARDLIGGIDWVRNNKNDQDILKTIEKAKAAFGGTEIMGKTILVVGLGAIGGKVANACSDLGMKVIGFDPYISEEAKSLLNNGIEINNNLSESYPIADYISLHLPLLDSTKHMINAQAFQQMKRGTVLLNFSRDLLVKNEDLKDALDQQIVKKYVTDFPDHFVANLDNIIAFPHLGASTEESEDNCAIMACKQLMAYVEKGEIINSVNYPNIKLDNFTTKSRLIILAKNNPSLAREIEKIMMDLEEFIKGKVSKVKGDYGYFAYDVDIVIKPETIAKLNALTGVTKVRLI